MKIALILIAGLGLLAIVALLAFVYVVQNVEQPTYSVLVQDDDFEIRDYPALVIAEVRRGGTRQQGLSAGFGPLARYIFAKERGGDEPIAMTAPVVQQQIGSGDPIAMTAPVMQARNEQGDWAVHFIMPAEYRLDTLPAPAGKDVRLTETAPRRVAVVRFSGRTTDVLLARREQSLRRWMEASGLTPVGAPLYAYYNDPFTPGFMRRNEVMIGVAED
ncbi:MAG: heme-binding protein [Thiohalocapsa sp.]